MQSAELPEPKMGEMLLNASEDLYFARASAWVVLFISFCIIVMILRKARRKNESKRALAVTLLILCAAAALGITTYFTIDSVNGSMITRGIRKMVFTTNSYTTKGDSKDTQTRYLLINIVLLLFIAFCALIGFTITLANLIPSNNLIFGCCDAYDFTIKTLLISLYSEFSFLIYHYMGMFTQCTALMYAGASGIIFAIRLMVLWLCYYSLIY